MALCIYFIGQNGRIVCLTTFRKAKVLGNKELFSVLHVFLIEICIFFF